MAASDVAVLELVRESIRQLMRLAPCACPNPKMPLLWCWRVGAPQSSNIAARIKQSGSAARNGHPEDCSLVCLRLTAPCDAAEATPAAALAPA